MIVTIFTAGAQETLPIWFFDDLSRSVEQPKVIAVALFVIVVSIVPVWPATRLTSEPRGVGGGRA